MSRKLRKIASLVLAAAMLMTCFSISGSAVGTATGNEAMNVGLALSAESAAPGDVITVTVSISNNYNATTMRWPVLYSTDVFELVGEDGGLTAPIDDVTSVAGSTTSTTNADFVPADYSSDYSAFTIQWIADSDGTTIGAFNSSTAVACFTFQLKVLDTASGTGTVLIPESSEHFYKMAVSDTADASSFYSAPVTFTVSDAVTCTIESGSAPVAPTLVGLGDTIIDEERGFIYGLPHGDNGGVTNLVEEGFAKVEGDGTAVCTLVGEAEFLGTGATVELKDSTGTTVKTYYVVIFGDTDGNGLIETFDTLDLIDFIGWNDCAYDWEDSTVPQVFAMDINADGAADDLDIAYIEDYAGWNLDDILQTYEGQEA